MAKREIRLSTDEILRKKCKVVKEIDERTLMLLDDMAETMYDANGVGLAAPQVGILKRVVTYPVMPLSALILFSHHFFLCFNHFLHRMPRTDTVFPAAASLFFIDPVPCIACIQHDFQFHLPFVNRLGINPIWMAKFQTKNFCGGTTA